MTKLLDQAIKKPRQLPEHDQDIVAAELFELLSEFPTPDERAAITRGRAAHARGEFATLDKLRHEMGLDRR
jgi:hypothetical protein